jgi:Ni/Co efflux regulator RcnB
MHDTRLKLFTFAIAFSLSFVWVPASADRAGNHKGGKNGHHQAKKSNKAKGYRSTDSRIPGSRSPAGSYPMHGFDERQRHLIHDYFAPQFQTGRCPPGLAKKYNGCMPPGQAKKWRIGYRLPRGVIFHSLPPHLLGQLGVPGPGYRYVRVAADVLLIAAGTGLVIDAIEDLNAM